METWQENWRSSTNGAEHRTPRRPGWLRWVLVVLVGAGGVVLSLFVYGVLWVRESELRTARFHLDAERLFDNPPR